MPEEKKVGHVPYKFYRRKVNELIDQAVRFNTMTEDERSFVRHCFKGNYQVLVLLFEAIFIGIASSQRKIVELKTGIGEVVGEIVEVILEKKLGKLEEKIENLDGEINDSGGKFEELKEKVEELEERVKELEEK